MSSAKRVSSAPYRPAAIANEFLDRCSREDKPLTPMQLLKLVYIAHGWHLATTGRPLLDEPVEAWKYGPVVASLFHEFKGFGGRPINRLAHSAEMAGCDPDSTEPELIVDRPLVPKADADTHTLLDWVWKVYGAEPAWELSRRTHEEGTPWSAAVAEMKKRHPDRDWVPNYPIDNEAIRKHYLELWNTRYGRKP